MVVELIPMRRTVERTLSMPQQDSSASSSDAPAPRVLEGKVAVVTGASRGIGADVARALAAAGADVALAARDQQALDELAGELQGAGCRALAVSTDVTAPGSVEALVARSVETFGHLDCAINNAGGGFTGKAPIADVALHDFQRMLELNLTSVFVSMKHEIAAMLQSGGGVIVNMSSGSGFAASPGMGPYVTAKHGLQGLTKVAALDYAHHGIRINAIAPGPIFAGPLAQAGDDFQRLAAESVPMRKVGRPEDVAAAAVWLCSDAAAFVTGATLPVDGGQLAGRP
jgi:NAD(P)-dependent dehydrogenase (short-subunit alcohol dehydrogenase family)